jgi:hypothetical protein
MAVRIMVIMMPLSLEVLKQVVNSKNINFDLFENACYSVMIQKELTARVTFIFKSRCSFEKARNKLFTPIF